MFLFQVIVLAMNIGAAIFAFVSGSVGLCLLAVGIAGWLLVDLIQSTKELAEDF